MINDEYCWTGEHPGGWECTTCTAQQTPQEQDTFLSTIEQLSIVTGIPEWKIADIIKRLQHAYRDEQERSFERVKIAVHLWSGQARCVVDRD